MKYTFAGPSEKDPDNGAANTSRLVNFYRETVGGRSTHVLKSVLGSEGFVDLDGVYHRAAQVVGDEIFAAHGGRLWRVSQSGEVRNLGAIDDGFTTISPNNGKVAVAANGNYFVYDEALNMVDPAIFSEVGSVSFMGQKTIITEKDGRRVAWSDVTDPTTFDGLAFATAEQRDEPILLGMPINGQFWVFKETCIEIWGDNGDLFYIPGSLIERGLKAPELITAIPSGAVFVGTDNKVHFVGGGMAPIGKRPVETAIEQGTPVGMTYFQDEGHEFVAILFQDRPSWVFDIGTAEWHERASGLGPWDVRGVVRAWDCFHSINHTGQIRRMVRNNRDDGKPLVRQATGYTLDDGGPQFTVAEMRFKGRSGATSVDRSSNPGSSVLEASGGALEADGGALVITTPADSYREPMIDLKVSRDNGHTWSGSKLRGLGRLGEYDRQTTYRGLGRGRQFTPQITVTDPVEITIDAQAYVRTA